MDMLYIIVQTIVLIGLLSGVLMFWSTNKLPAQVHSAALPSLTIIIPARNEALRLPPLLKSLQTQTLTNLEIIVVDDDSTDNTKEVAISFGAKVIKSELLSQMSPGKANACANGARVANGQCLLFLDADVQLVNPNSLEKMLQGFHSQGGKGILSIQPYHRIEKFYENLSVIFNIVMITGMNVFTVWKNRLQTAGSFGPCILCDRASYMATGGHEASAESIMDDFALSDVFIAKQLPVTNYVGKGIITMRMYEEGASQLVEGGTKNLATASKSTNRLVMLLVQFWILGVIMAVVAPIVALLTASTPALICSLVVYLIYGIHAYMLAKRVGNFTVLIILFYPLFVLFFTAIFLYSLYRTHILHSVMWRGRKINV